MKSLLMFLIPLFLFGCGKDGAIGPQGEQGPAGQKGIDGANGSKIYSGKSAPTAATGVNGDFFINLTNGDLYGPKSQTGWGQPFNLKGPQGPAGPSGATILSGQTAPALTVGNIGDFYINIKEMVIYGPKTATSWGSPVSLKSDAENGVSVYLIKPDWNKNLVVIEGTNEKTFTTFSDEYTIPATANDYLVFYVAGAGWSSLKRDITLNNWQQLERSGGKNFYIIPYIILDHSGALSNTRFESIITSTTFINPTYKFTMEGTVLPDIVGGNQIIHQWAVWILIKSYNYKELKAKAPEGVVDTDRYFRIQKF
ncbi:collagen-like protein [Sphingobacterium sp. ML3W]|uniref:hypothetical protein n=1 Tax=Sphingobacterium sp. ML3W TaxID=1538644 RepID=UPI00249C3388|nr:hypothetical protein [Sphingobacterium sp. ML3W]WFA78179.1 collagen-like protein [Sphingobacterium sp. ML3W]